MGLEVHSQRLTRDDIYLADEAFFTGTAAETIPITKLDGREIGAGKPGPVFAKVLAAFRKRVLTEGTRI